MLDHGNFLAIGEFGTVNTFCPNFMGQTGISDSPEAEFFKITRLIGEHKYFFGSQLFCLGKAG
jgi:hypothetical protein